MDADALVGTLLKAGGTLPDALAAHLVRHALSQPLMRYLSADDLLDTVRAAGTEVQLRRWVERHGQVGAERIRVQLAESGATLGAMAPDGAPERWLERIMALGPVRAGWAARYVDQALLRELLAPVFQDFLMRFAAGIPTALGIPAAEGATHTAAGWLGRLGKEVGQGRGRRILDVGKSVVGGLGLDLEERIQTLAREFSRGATDAFREALQRRLEAAEGKALLHDLLARGLDAALATPLEDLAGDRARVPIPFLLDELPAIWAHNQSEPLGRGILEAEVRAYYAVEGARPLGDWLEQVGVLEVLAPRLQARAAEHAREFFETDAFRAWLAQCLAEAETST